MTGRPRVHPIGANRTMARRKRVVEEGGLVTEVFLEPNVAGALRKLQARWGPMSINAAIERAIMRAEALDGISEEIALAGRALHAIAARARRAP
jgi:hypothetical protein